MAAFDSDAGFNAFDHSGMAGPVNSGVDGHGDSLRPAYALASRLYNVVLDLLEEPDVPGTPGFRNQLDRAALSVSNNIAEGFD